MKFPGRRKNKHYFPVSESSRIRMDQDPRFFEDVYVIGVDQLIVDVEINTSDEEIESFKKENQFYSMSLAWPKFMSTLRFRGKLEGSLPEAQLETLCIIILF